MTVITDAAPKTGIWTADCYRYGDLAVALYASYADLDGQLSVEELAVAAAAGVRNLGGMATVRRVCDDWDSMNIEWMNGRLAERAYEDAVRALFAPYDPARLNRAIGHDISRFRP